MLRIPPALWLLGLAVGVSMLTREPAPRGRPAAFQASRAPSTPASPKLALRAAAEPVHAAASGSPSAATPSAAGR